MFRNKLMRIILIVGSVLIIVGVTLMTWMLVTEDDRNVIKVSLDAGDRQPIEFEALHLVPGESCEYGIRILKRSTDTLDLTLDFVENDDGALKNYARVKILAQESVIYDDLLVNALDNESILLSVDFKEKKNTELQILYYLPMEVGNEAKNTESEFSLVLIASNE